MSSILTLAYWLVSPLLAILLIWRGFPSSCHARKSATKEDHGAPDRH